MTAFSDRLAAALDHFDTFTLGSLAKGIGVPPDKVRRAAKGANGQATPARVYLRVCMHLGIDPMTGAAREQPLAEFRDQWFGIVLTMNRIERRQNIRQAAEAMDISKTSLWRMEKGNTRSFEGLAAACRYLDRHPYEFLRPDVSYETLTGDKTSSAIASSHW